MYCLILPICSISDLLAQNNSEGMDLPGQGIGVNIKKDAGSKKYAVDDMLDLAMQPVYINTAPLPDYDFDKLDYALSEGLALTPGGTLWACWIAGGDNDKAFVVLSSSKDNGDTWSKPRAVLDPRISAKPLDRRSLVANVWTDPKGNLWLFYDQAIGYFDGRAGVWATVCSNPDDEELRWSAPQRISDGSALNKPIVTKNGEWMLPISIWPRTLMNSQFRDQYFHELDGLRGANVVVSVDQGKTWQRRGNTVKSPYPTVDEPMLVERGDGSLWMTMRTLKGMWESFSADGGYTWSEARESQINHANARHFITRLHSGRLLLVKHGEKLKRSEGDSTLLKRTKLTAFLSEDDGETWSEGFLLVDRGVSYPDGVQAEDGTIYICYDYDRWFSGEIWMARFTEEDILARKMVNPLSTNEILISKAKGLTERERNIRIEHRNRKKSRLKEIGVL